MDITQLTIEQLRDLFTTADPDTKRRIAEVAKDKLLKENANLDTTTHMENDSQV